MQALRGTWLVLLAMMLAIGCHSSQPPQQNAGAERAEPKPAQEVAVFAAASTQNAVEAVLHEFERLNPDVKVHASFGPSSSLAEQIARGTAADLFLSANPQWAAHLKQKSLVAEQHDLLGNQLVVIEPADAGWHVGAPQDLLKEEIAHIAIGDPESVPVGTYAKQALAKLDLWDKIAEKLVTTNDSRHVLTMVEMGEAEAGIAYTTDAAASNQVKMAFPIDRDLTDPIIYPLVLTKRGAQNSAGRELYHFLQTSSAATVFRQSGFRVQQKSGVQ